MSSFKDLNVTIFELISYIFPGFLVVIFLLLFTPYGLEPISNNFLVILLVSYIVGNLLHFLSDTISFRGIGWSLYHRFKERNRDSHGVKRPKGVVGKLMKKLRYYFLELEKRGKMSVVGLIKKKYDHTDLDSYDFHLIKEVILAKQPDILNSYSHLNYQRIFNSSLSIVFFLFAVTIFVYDYFYILKVYFGPTIFYEIDHLGYLLSLLAFLLSHIFNKRSIFFKSYRSKLLDAVTLIYLSES